MKPQQISCTLSRESDKLLRTLLNKAHAVGQDDYREGASDQGVKRRYDELRQAEDAMVCRIFSLEQHAANLDVIRELRSCLSGILNLHDDAVFVNGSDDDSRVGVAINRIREALAKSAP